LSIASVTFCPAIAACCTNACSDRLRVCSRYDHHRNLTIVQGDAHVWNCFLPGDDGDDVRLFDSDAWHVDVAAVDAWIDSIGANPEPPPPRSCS
jgi:hypothetical protein